MKKILTFAVWLLAVLLIGTAIVIAWYAGASQPQVDGEIRLQGLKQKVDIVRDAEGVPHIYAQHADDAYFALGFVHAQDRLWQMEMNRRIAAGRTAEILGPGALDTDRFLRTLGIHRNAQAIVGNLSPIARATLESYARGVNAYLVQRTGPLPPEFILTGAPSPEPWQPADSIGWQTMLAWDLGANWSQEVLRMRLSQRLSLKQINEFLAPYPGDPPPVTRDYTQLYRELSRTTEQLAALAAMAPLGYVEGMGSNNWIVSGALSKSGKPLMANDPHLGLTAPSLWYLAHLSAPGLNVIGATLPGIPGVVLGRNDRIAWGFTNTGTDVQDLFIERINPDNLAQYQGPESWLQFQRRTEIIKVKGQSDVKLEVRETRHGPVVTGALPVISKVPVDSDQFVVSFSWTALRPDDRTFEAVQKFNSAGNWQEFLEAAKDFSAPQQNIGYADVEGNIGFVAPARVPVRKPENDLKGLALAPGWDARYDWDGFIPFEELPQAYNPSSQRIITANQKIIDEDYPHLLTTEWTWPYRYDRINSLLNSTLKHDTQSFTSIQADVMSLAARELLPMLRTVEPTSVQGKNALEKLKRWQGDMRMDAIEPLIFSAWMRETSRMIFEDELGSELLKDYWELRNVHQAMVNVLKNTEGQAKWCADTADAKAMLQRSCAEVLAAALEAALSDLQRRYGADMRNWRWGDAHSAHSDHRPFGKIDWLARWFDIRVPTGGDTFTVNVGRHNLRDENRPFASRHAASFRAIYDLSDLESSSFIHTSGQSGNVFSRFYKNFAERWADVKFIPMKTRRDYVEEGRLGILVLMP
jgi:penicillin amidase